MNSVYYVHKDIIVCSVKSVFSGMRKSIHMVNASTVTRQGCEKNDIRGDDLTEVRQNPSDFQRPNSTLYAR